MGRKLIVAVVFGASLLGLGVTPASAHEVAPSPAFGEHVSGMAPEHPLEHGGMFGACVSAMARGADCPHH